VAVGVAIEHAERFVRCMLLECAVLRGTPALSLHLAVELRARTERCTATGPVRRPLRPGSRSVGPLLMPRLRSSAGDQASRLQTAGARTVGVLFRANGLVQNVLFDLGGDDGVRELHVVCLLV